MTKIADLILLSTVVCGLNSAFSQSKHFGLPIQKKATELLGTNEQLERVSTFNKLPFPISHANKNNTTLNTKSLVVLYDSIYYSKYQGIYGGNNGWDIYPWQKIVNFVYDANYNIISELVQIWNGPVLDEEYPITYTYDANNNRTSELMERWNGTEWMEFYKYTYTYDANNNMIEMNTKEVYNLNQYTYTYDTHNNRTSELKKSWNGNAWVNSYQYTYTYDTHDNRKSELRKSWNDNAWVNSYQYTYEYDANNNTTTEFWEQWNVNAWVNSCQYTYSYDVTNKLVSKLQKYWISNAWVDYFQYTYSYDSNNNLIGELKKYWSVTEWEYIDKYTYTYDANNIQTSVAYNQLGWDGTLTTTGEIIYYNFHTLTVGIKDLSTEKENISVYPNPASDIVNLYIKESNNEDMELNIYNVQGILVMKDILKENNQIINVRDFSNGIYVIEIKLKGGYARQRLVIQR
jgi:hypothetical protein